MFILDLFMQTASIVGDEKRSRELYEKPSIYSTVVHGHTTSVSHQTPKFSHSTMSEDRAQGLISLDPRNDFPVNVIESQNWTVPVKIEKKYLVKSEINNFQQDIKMNQFNPDLVFTQSREGNLNTN